MHATVDLPPPNPHACWMKFVRAHHTHSCMYGGIQKKSIIQGIFSKTNFVHAVLLCQSMSTVATHIGFFYKIPCFCQF